MLPEHILSNGDDTVTKTTITYTGALSVNSGKKKGRVPKEKRIVYDEVTKDVSNQYFLLMIHFLDHLVGIREHAT